MLAMTTMTIASQAQTGSILVYGEAGISSSKDPSENKYTSWQVAPGIGYQFTKNWTAGVTGFYGKSKYNPVVGANSTESNYGAGLFARYTVPLNSTFSIFGQAEGLYTGGEDNGTDEYNGFVARVFPAVRVDIGRGVALNFDFGGIQYRSTKQDGADESNTNFDVTLGGQSNFGVSINIGGKK